MDAVFSCYGPSKLEFKLLSLSVTNRRPSCPHVPPQSESVVRKEAAPSAGLIKICNFLILELLAGCFFAHLFSFFPGAPTSFSAAPDVLIDTRAPLSTLSSAFSREVTLNRCCQMIVMISFEKRKRKSSIHERLSLWGSSKMDRGPPLRQQMCKKNK